MVGVQRLVRPSLNAGHRAARRRWAIERQAMQLDPAGHLHPTHMEIHVDEKWFFATKLKRIVYKFRGTATPAVSTQSRSHIPKVMFFAAVARPSTCKTCTLPDVLFSL